MQMLTSFVEEYLAHPILPMTMRLSAVSTRLYSQTRIKCSRPISSLPGLQGQKLFADAIIKILIPTKSISDKNCYDQLFINEVVKIFTFQFDESVTKFYVVKVLLILMKFSYVVVKYHNIFLVGTRKKNTSINFQEEEKTEKWSFLVSIT